MARRAFFATTGQPLMLMLLLGAAVILVGCGSSGGGSTTAAPSGAPAASATAATSTSSAGVNPNQRETLPPGDIPDTIAYVPYTDRTLGLTISTPEGWSRSTTVGGVTFTDKLNRVSVFTRPASVAPTPASVRRSELSSISSSVKSFSLQSITAVQRPAGGAVRIAYLGDSPPDPVTGKVGTLAFERYDFFHGRREVVILLSSPKGSDNVDPWRKVTDSLRFTP